MRPQKAQNVTIPGDWTFSGVFKSLGFEDIATAERMELSDLYLTLGATGSTLFIIRQADNNNYMAILGGQSLNSSGLYLFGSTHAQAGDVTFTAAGSNTLQYDDSASLWDFKANDIITTGDVFGFEPKKYIGQNLQTGTTYELVLGDAGKMVDLSNAAAIALTIPANSAVAFPVDTRIDLNQYGAGLVTVGITTDTLRGDPVSQGQYKGLSLWKRTATEWVIYGGTTA